MHRPQLVNPWPANRVPQPSAEYQLLLAQSWLSTQKIDKPCLLSVILMSKILLCLHYSHGLMPVCMKSCLFAKTRCANATCDHFCEPSLATTFILSSFSSLQKSLLDSFIPNILLFDPPLWSPNYSFTGLLACKSGASFTSPLVNLWDC